MLAIGSTSGEVIKQGGGFDKRYAVESDGCVYINAFFMSFVFLMFWVAALHGSLFFSFIDVRVHDSPVTNITGSLIHLLSHITEVISLLLFSL